MSERFSSADAAWLHMDSPTNLMVINSVMTFDEPLDWDRVRLLTQERVVDRFPRFSQRPVESRLPMRPPKWVDDPDFSLEHHMHHRALPAPGGQDELEELVADLMMMPLDRSRPLWHTYMIDNFGAGCAVITRMHHCIADGISLARVMMSLTDADPQNVGIDGAGRKALDTPARTRALPAVAMDSARAVVGVGSAVARQGAHIATSPSHAAHLAGAIGRDAATLARLVLTPADAATAFKGDPGISRRVAWMGGIPLDEVKRIAHANRATVNDVVLAAITGALRHYLQEHGGTVSEIQAMIPFNLRPLDKPVPSTLGNKFGLVFLPLPVGTSGAYRRLVEVHKRMHELKEGRDGAVSYGVLSAAGYTPEPVERRVIDLFTAKGTAVMTNVPGPPEPVYYAGKAVRTVMFWAPTAGHVGMSLSIFSYREEMAIGLMTDAALVPDPRTILAGVRTELDTLGRLDVSHRASGRRRRQPAGVH